MGLWKFLSTTRSDGHMSLSFPVRIRIELVTISCPQSNGWLVFVNHKVRWPHEFVLSGQNKDRIGYNQLSPVQWMVGFCQSIREESDTKIREHMLDYAIDLLDDLLTSGLRQSPAMLCFCAEWNRVRLQAG